MFAALLPILNTVVGGVVNKFFPNPEDELKRQQIQNEFITKIIEQQQAMEMAAADIVKTEAASTHWLAANWRPLSMLVFVTLIVARWFGWTAPNLPPEEYLKLWDIVQLGFGGYVIGRSAEKILPSVADALKNRK